MSRLSGFKVINHPSPSLWNSVAANSIALETVSVPGARPGDFVMVATSGHDANEYTLSGRVTSNDNVTLLCHADGGGATVSSGTLLHIKVVPLETM